jgi:hypothetical protein
MHPNNQHEVTWDDFRDPTTHILLPKDSAVLGRARAWLREVPNQGQGLGWPYAIVTGTLIAIAVIFFIDVTNFRFAVTQFMPELSGGDTNGPLKDSIVFAFAAGTVLSGFALRQASHGLGWINKALDGLGIIATLILVAGAAVFLSASVSSSTGGDADTAGGWSNVALGLGLGAIYVLSVAASRMLVDHSLGALGRIAIVKADRARAAAVRAKVERVESGCAAVHHADRKIDAMGQPGALAWAAAIAMAETIGKITSQFHELMCERELVEAKGGDPDLSEYTDEEFAGLTVDAVRGMPVKRLQQLGQYLAKFTPDYIYYQYLQHVEA